MTLPPVVMTNVTSHMKICPTIILLIEEAMLAHHSFRELQSKMMVLSLPDILHLTCCQLDNINQSIGHVNPTFLA
jgi:hypothetical protein